MYFTFTFSNLPAVLEVYINSKYFLSHLPSSLHTFRFYFKIATLLVPFKITKQTSSFP